MTQRPEKTISVIIPVGWRSANAVELYGEYKQGLDATHLPYQVIFVIDGPNPAFQAGVESLAKAGEPIQIVNLARTFGEATAIMAGFEQSQGNIILTLPAYFQIDAAEIGKLIAGLDQADLTVAHRWPRKGGWLEGLRRGAFHGLVKLMTKIPMRDLGCGARAFKRIVLEEVSLYGDQHRFLPMLADRQGFKVLEVDIRQSPKDRFEGVYGLREYTRPFLDVFTVFFLVRFTKKPLRFFGMVGVSTFAIGVVLTFVMVIQRLFFNHQLADRPALLLSSLLVVLGLQLFAIGLLGELIIFTHAKSIKDYQVDRVISFPRGAEHQPVTESESADGF